MHEPTRLNVFQSNVVKKTYAHPNFYQSESLLQSRNSEVLFFALTTYLKRRFI